MIILRISWYYHAIRPYIAVLIEQFYLYLTDQELKQLTHGWMLFQTTLPITNSRTRTQEQNTAKSARNIKKPHLLPRIKSPKRTIKNRNFHELKGGKTEEITKNRKEKKKQGGSSRAHLLRRLRGRRVVWFRRRRRRVLRGGGGEVVHGDGTWAREREREIRQVEFAIGNATTKGKKISSFLLAQTPLYY